MRKKRGKKKERGREPVSGSTRSDTEGTDALNERHEGQRLREMHGQTDGETDTS